MKKAGGVGPMIKLPFVDKLGSVGMVGERKALALLCLGFYMTLFFMISLSARTELPEWLPVFTAMTLMYGVTFFAVAAEWFWGRWVATGLGYWGLTMTGMALVAARGLPPAMIIFGIMHGLIAACLAGEKMAAAYDAKPEWRERWKLDDQGVIRVRKSVTRAASSLPALIMFALAPRDGAGSLLAPAALTLALLGIGGLLARRTWSVFALGSAGMATLGLLLRAPFPLETYDVLSVSSIHVSVGSLFMNAPEYGAFASALLIAATLPFFMPMMSYLRRR
jgi:hypothetical protein